MGFFILVVCINYWEKCHRASRVCIKLSRCLQFWSLDNSSSGTMCIWSICHWVFIISLSSYKSHNVIFYQGFFRQIGLCTMKHSCTHLHPCNILEFNNANSHHQAFHSAFKATFLWSISFSVFLFPIFLYVHFITFLNTLLYFTSVLIS